MPSLDSSAVGELLHALATSRGDSALAAALREPRRRPIVRAIHALSGGNCRFVASLDRCLSEKGLQGLAEPVTQTVRGELAPAYERRMNERPPQQYKILQALAEHQGRAVNVTELARYMFLSPQAVSRQLQELLRAGFLLRTQVGRETCYELSDPLVRFVLDFKHGRDNALPLLVRAVHHWCEVDRLYRAEYEGFPLVEAFRFDGFVEVSSESQALPEAPAAFVALDPSANPRVEKQVNGRVTKCLELRDAALREEGLEPQVLALMNRADQELSTLFHAAGLSMRGQNVTALEALDQWLRTGAASTETTHDARMMAHAMRVYALLALERCEDAVAAADAVLRQDETGTSHAVDECRAMIAVNRGVALLKLARCEDAATQFDQIVQQTDPGAFPEICAVALINRAAALERLGRYAEAIAALDLVTEHFHRAVRACHREPAATAQVAKASILERLGQHENALAACDAALRIHPSDPRALVMRVLFLCPKGDAGELLRAVEAALEFAKPGQSERAILAAGLFERMTGMESTVQLAAAIFGRDRRSLLHGLMLWVRNRIAKSPADAQQTQRRLHTLRPIFEDDPEGGFVMSVAEALARTARGDARALLDLPIELRRLVAE
jgi:tetratricopeptide (TPR) repeat protein